MPLRTLCTGLLAAVIAFGGAHPSEPTNQRREEAVAVGNMPDPIEAQAITLDVFYADVQRQIDEYLSWQHEQDVAAWVAGVREWQRQHQPPRNPSSSPVLGSGDCSAVAAVVGWGTVKNESGGNPFVVNSSDHRGCAQISGGWWGGACSHLNWQDVNDQAECARIVLRLQGPSAWAGTYSP